MIKDTPWSIEMKGTLVAERLGRLDKLGWTKKQNPKLLVVFQQVVPLINVSTCNYLVIWIIAMIKINVVCLVTAERLFFQLPELLGSL